MHNTLCIIDPHVHFFDLSRGEYHWLKKQNPPFWPDKGLINKNVGPEDLRLPRAYQLKGLVHIESGYNNQFPDEEIAWLDVLWEQTKPKPILTAVAAIDLCLPEDAFILQLERILHFNTVRGLRHIFDEQAIKLCKSGIVKHNLALIAAHNLHFELQFNVTNVDDTMAVVKLFEGLKHLKLAINHAGFAPTKSPAEFKQWAQNMLMLATLPNAHVKCSGFEMSNRNYNDNDIKRVLRTLVNMFGERRVMCASNFPLTLFSNTYTEYWRAVIHAIRALNFNVDALCCANAADFYQLSKT